MTSALSLSQSSAVRRSCQPSHYYRLPVDHPKRLSLPLLGNPAGENRRFFIPDLPPSAIT